MTWSSVPTSSSSLQLNRRTAPLLIDQIQSARDSYDVVVVGSGPAGLSFAQRLIGTRLNVLLLEAGGERETERGRADLAGTIAGGSAHPALGLYRVRALGGTSAIWGGRSIAFDPIDFEPRAWISGPGWPIAYQDVAAYYAEAFAICDAGVGTDDPYIALAGKPSELISGFDNDVIRTSLERFSLPTNFWSKYRASLIADRDVHVLANATATRLQHSTTQSKIASIDIDHKGVHRSIKARAFVVAAGGFETPRLLLNSDDVCADGLGNDFGHVGRHYMGHFCATFGRLVVDASRVVANQYDVDPDGIYVRRRLALTAAAQRQYGLLNTVFRLHHPEPADPAHRDPVLSAMYFAKAFVQREYAARFGKRRLGRGALFAHLGNIARDVPSLTTFAKLWLRDRILADRKLPSIVRGPHLGSYAVEFQAEQSPCAESRLSLRPERDRHGMRRLHVDWRLEDTDVEAMKRAYSVLAHQLAATQTGHLDADLSQLAPCLRSSAGLSGHHIGTTRMSEDVRDGVVDCDCRVHGIANLFVAGSSVFPTSSQANPTLTIVALALRLADHVCACFGRMPEVALATQTALIPGMADAA